MHGKDLSTPTRARGRATYRTERAPSPRALLWVLLCSILCGAASPAFAQGGNNSVLREIEFKDATVQDAIRIISDLSGTNIVATPAAGGRRFTLFLRALTVSEAIDSISRVAGLWHRRNDETGVTVVMTTEEYFRDIVVYREERTEYFTLRYQNVVQVARTIESMYGTDRVNIDLRDEGDDLRLPDATLGEGRTGGGSFRGSRNRSLSDRGSDRNTRTDVDRLTPAQIELLEQTVERRPGEDPLLLSESTLAAVRKQNNQLTIFVAVNREHNQLFVRTADEKAMEEIRQLVAQSDRPTPQVLLETKILSVQIDDEYQYAFDFTFNSEQRILGPNDGQPANPLNPNALLGSEGTLGIVNANLAGSSTFVFQAMNDKVRARLQVLEREGRIDVLATPMLLAANNRPAKIFIGEETVLTTGFSGSESTVAGTGNTVVTQPIPTTETVEVGNTLTILPSINADRSVVMRLLQEVSQVQRDGARIPVIAGGEVQEVPIDTVDRSTMEGTAMAKDGLTVMVGGMITETNAKGERKVPVLGDVPGLGALFKEKNQLKEREQLVLLITPHVFSTPEEAEAVSRNRIGDLTQAPNQIDVYLDQLERTRSATPRGRAANARVRAAAPAPVPPRSALEENYVQLTRFAAERMRKPRLAQVENARIQNVGLPNNRPFFLVSESAIETRPKRSWRQGGLYVTAVEARNRSTTPLTLDERRFAGRWLAASVQFPTLPPKSKTFVYLVSDEPFQQAAVP